MAGDTDDTAPEQGGEQTTQPPQEVLSLDEVCERACVSARVVTRDLRLGSLKDLTTASVEAWLISRSIDKIERRTRRERPERARTSIHGKWG